VIEPHISSAMKRILRYVADKDVHPAIQFGKYGFVGSIAVLVDIFCFYLLALFVFPALTPDDVVAKAIASAHRLLIEHVPYFASQQWLFDLTHWQIVQVAESRRTIYYVIDRALVFIIANFVAYSLNAAWVFTPGRHARHREVMWFFAVAIMSFLIGTTLGAALIAVWEMDTSLAVVCNVGSAVLINFVFRKYWVFLQ
jgi:putative flippase GtrA